MNDLLLPCPKCSETDTLVVDWDGSKGLRVFCDCGVEGPLSNRQPGSDCEPEAPAILKWNNWVLKNRSK